MFRVIVFLCLNIGLLFAQTASIDIEKSATALSKIAVESYRDTGISEFEQNQIDAMLLNDIKVSDHLEAVSNPFKNGFDTPISGSEMKAKNIELLLKYKISKTNNGFSIETKLFDPLTNRPFSQRFSVPEFKQYPFLAHNIAVSVNDYLKAPSIDWMKNYVIMAKDMGARKSDIVIADYTLSYQKTIISGGYNIFPKWAGTAQSELYYTAYEKLPTLYKYNIYSGRKTKIISSEGMLICSDVSKDGKKILLTMPSGALPDIFLYDTQSGTKNNLTNFAGIDVNGNFIDNESKIAFVSDRLGYPTIFTKPISSASVEQLVFSPKYNSSFSAKNNLLVYGGKENGDNNIFLVNTITGQRKQITLSGWNSSPRLSNAGDAVMFFKTEKGRTNLGIFRLNSSSTFLFPMNIGKIKSLDW